MKDERQKKVRRAHSRKYSRTAFGTDSGVIMRLLTMLIVVAACLLSVTIFFKVQEIEVRGNEYYDAQTILDASGLHVGDSLVTMNKSAVAGRIEAALPYIEQVRIARQLPGKVIVDVRESSAVFSVQDDSGAYWLISFSGRVLEQVAEAEAKNRPEIVGFTISSPVVGEAAKTEQSENLNAAMLLTAALEGTGIAHDTTKLDVTKPYDIVLWYKDQYDVRFGGTDKLEYKVQYLQAVLEQLADYQTGTIDLTFETEKVARFSPW